MQYAWFALGSIGIGVLVLDLIRHWRDRPEK